MYQSGLNVEEEGRNVRTAKQELKKMKNDFKNEFKVPQQHHPMVDKPLSEEAVTFYHRVDWEFNLGKLTHLRRAEKEKISKQIHNNNKRIRHQQQQQDPPAAQIASVPEVVKLQDHWSDYVKSLRRSFGSIQNNCPWVITDEYLDIIELEQFIHNNSHMQTLADWLEAPRDGRDTIAQLLANLCPTHKIENMTTTTTLDKKTLAHTTLFSPSGSEHQIMALATLGAILLEEVVYPTTKGSPE